MNVPQSPAYDTVNSSDRPSGIDPAPIGRTFKRAVSGTIAALVMVVSVAYQVEAAAQSAGRRIRSAVPGTATLSVVNSQLDEPDASPGDSICASTPSGVCTLRAALQECSPTGCMINFSITIPTTVGAYATIQPLSPLPTIPANTSINGRSQDTTASRPDIFLDGSRAPAGTSGFVAAGAGVSINGFAIGLFSGYGISSSFATTRIEENYVGMNPTGAAAPNGDGILIDGGADSTGSIIGVSATACPAPSLSCRNVVSGNTRNGVILGPLTTGNQVHGNYIGTDPLGDLARPNGAHGIEVFGSGNSIGQTGASANIIANNGGAGVAITRGTGNSIRANTIRANGGLGIDLGGNGALEINDRLDSDTGPNNLQNSPVITNVTYNGFDTVVSGTLHSTPNTQFNIDLYRNTVVDSSGSGEGQSYLATFLTMTDGNGDATFQGQSYGNTSGSPHTATATRAAAPLDTSEFGVQSADVAINKFDSTGGLGATAGQGFTYTVSVTNSSASQTVSATVTDTMPTNVTFTGWTCTPTGVGSACGAASGSGSILETVSLGPNGNVSYSINAQTDPSFRGVVRNTATVAVQSPGVDSTPNNNSSFTDITVAGKADISVFQAINETDNYDRVLVSTPYTLTLRVYNNGPSTATNVVVTDTLPSGTTVSSFPANCSVNVNPQTAVTTVTCTIASIAPFVTATIDIVATTSTLGPGTNTVSATLAEPPATPTGSITSSTATYNFVGPFNPTVNVFNDAVDADLSDAFCDSDPIRAGEQCTLRAAIQQSNNYVGTNTINVPAGNYALTIVGAFDDTAASGDLDITTSMNIAGAGATATIIDGAALGDRIFHASNAQAVTISGVTIRGGLAPQFSRGGGLLVSGSSTSTFVLSDSIVRNNSADVGGGIANESGGILLTDQPLSRALRSAAFTALAANGLTIDHSAVINNSATAGDGGGILSRSQPLTLNNVTLSGNSALNGSGIATEGGVTTIKDATIAFNTATSGGAVSTSQVSTASQTVFMNTIVSNNTNTGFVDGNCTGNGLISPSGPNLEDGAACGFAGNGGLSNTIANLGALSNNLGNGTPTHALLPGSPAIDTGSSPSTDDQRRLLRPKDGDGNGTVIDDIGAFELQVAAAPSITSLTPSSGPSSGGTSVTITGTNFAAGATVAIAGAPASNVVVVSSTTITFTTPPQAAGTKTVVVTNPDGQLATSATGFTYTTDLAITTTALRSGTTGSAYSETLTASGGAPPYTWTVASGALPPGLSLASNGSISGTPTTTGIFDFTARVTDSSIDTVTRLFSITIAAGSTDVSISKTGPTSAVPGRSTTYNLTVTNTGSISATSVVVTETPFPGAQFVSATTPCAGGFPCSLGSIAPGASVPISVTYSIPAGATGSITNTAGVSATNGDTNTANDSASTTATLAPDSDLSVTKSGPASFTPGTNITFNIVATNNGPSTATGVTLTDPTPSGLTFVSATGACANGFPCALGTLTPGQSLPVSVTYAVPSGYTPTTVSNTVTISPTDASSANNTATATSSSGASADLSIVKTGPASVTAGQSVTYSIAVTNAGPSDASSVNVTDTPSANLTFVSASGACTALPCTIASIAAGTTQTISAVFNVAATATGSISNNASIASSGTPDPLSGNNSSTVTSTVGGSADVSIVKTGPTSVTAGQSVTYSIAVTNNGPSDASSVTVTDTPSANLTFVSASGACTAFPCTIASIAAGATQTISVVFSVSANATGNVSNTAAISSSATPDANAANNSSTVTSATAGSADVSIVKTGPTSVTAGQNVTYSIAVTNNGPSNASSVTVTDTPSANLTFVSASGACTAFPCTIASLGAGTTQTISAVFSVAANATGNVSNTAAISSSGTPDANAANNSSTVTSATAGSADVSIIKTGPTVVTAGQSVTYSIAVTNNGPSNASSVTVTDTPSANLTFVSASGACTAFPCTIPSIAAGTTQTINAVFNVASNATGNVSNTAAISSSGTPDANAANNSSTATSTTSGSADVSIVKTGPTSVTAGQSVTYSIAVTNNGPSNASNVTVTDTPSANLTFVSASGACTAFPCTIASLAAGTTQTISATFNVAANATGNVSNTAAISSSGTPDANAANNSSTVTSATGASADLSIVKTGPASVTAGQSVTYSIAVTNAGPSDASTVNVTDTPSANLTFVSASGACTALPCTIASIAAGTTQTISAVFNVAASATGSISNSASIASSGTPDPLSGNNSSTVTSTVGGSADVSIVKTGPTSVTAGQSVTYSIAVTNNGPSNASSVTVTDTPSANLTFVSASGACTAFPCTIASIAAGTTQTISATFNVSANATGNVSNTAAISSSATPDANAANNSSTATSTTSGSADVSIVKTGPTSVTAGQSVTYSIAVTNNGPSNASSVTVTDTPSANLTFVSASGACSAFPCTIASIAAGATQTISATFNVAANATGNVSNTAAISSSGTPDPNAANNSSTANSQASGSADLSILKTGPASFTPGSNITYTINVTNSGPSVATGVTLNDPTPAGLTFVSASGACSTSVSPCALGSMQPGTSATITVTYDVPSSYTGSITNSASVSSVTTDPTTNNTSTAAATSSSQADLGITKIAPASFTPGQNVTFTITVSNNGPSNATGVTLNDPTPAGLSFVSATSPCSAGVAPCALQDLVSGGSSTISVTYAVPASFSGTTISNTASIFSQTSDPNGNNNSKTVTVSGVPSADLSVMKSVTPLFTPGRDVTYTLTVTNNGPSNAANVTLTDPTPAGLTLLSASAPCANGFPCPLGSLNSGAVRVITATYRVSPSFTGGTITNTASVSSGTNDPVSSNNSATASSSGSASSDVAITKTGIGTVSPGAPIQYTITVTNDGPSDATGIVINDPTPTGLAFESATAPCATGFPCSVGSLASGSSVTITANYTVLRSFSGAFITNSATISSSSADPSSGNNSAQSSSSICSIAAPTLLEPTEGATVTSSPVTFRWTAVAGAIRYNVYRIVTVSAEPGPALIGSTTGTSLTVDIPEGTIEWYVEAIPVNANCPPIASARRKFTRTTVVDPGCSGVSGRRLVPAVPGEITSDKVYEFSWSPDIDKSYEVEEATDINFSNIITRRTVTGDRTEFEHTSTEPTPYFYRVRAKSSCATSPNPSDFSLAVRIVVVPPPPANKPQPDQSTQFGKEESLVQRIFIPGDDDTIPLGTISPSGLRSSGNTGKTVTVTTTQPWITVTPTTAVVPPQGTIITVTAKPAGLPVGTNTGTVSITTVAPTGPPTTLANVPISINLVTPITPTAKSRPPENALIIPSVSHISGARANFQSDVRIANTTGDKIKYQLTFTPTTANGTEVGKQTVIEIEPGVTTAMDDIVKRWYGLGSLNDGTLGSLEIRPLNFAGKTVNSAGTIQYETVASSRTYDQKLVGSLSQFVPAIPFSSFVGRGTLPGLGAISIQQIAQNAAFRTNLGLVEGSGELANVQVSIFNAAGAKLDSFRVDLKPAEHLQLNSVLSGRNLTLDDGRIELEVISDTGKVTAFGTVIDNRSGDPILVPAVQFSTIAASRYVVPGLTHISNDRNQWRSEMRIFNSSKAAVLANLMFIPANDPTNVKQSTVRIEPGEVKALDNVVETVFGQTNITGAVQVVTATDTALVVTARTYDSRLGGTVGQFSQAVTPQEANGIGDRALEVLQLEESDRFRTNMAFAEVTGKPVSIEVRAVIPEAKITPMLRLSLQPNEFRQISGILKQMGLVNVYNVRMSVRVVGGTGRLAVNASVIDNVTQDPYNVPGQ
ncbi:MAG TPA: choice-of-anchor Q domain-containing protein [Thermoanaerobaculia bacterium]|nr:choice-of-anchor Q domain-containing protein [Thermoanaerobaculia bacterium]